MSAPGRIVCRIASVEPPPGHAFDRAALVAAIETELALLLDREPLPAGPAPAPVAGDDVPTTVPASVESAGRDIARHIHRRLTAAGRTR